MDDDKRPPAPAVAGNNVGPESLSNGTEDMRAELELSPAAAVDPKGSSGSTKLEESSPKALSRGLDGETSPRRTFAERLRSFFFSLRGITTVLYSLSFFVLGLCLSTLGPALLSLSYQLNDTLQQAALAFTIRSVGYALGSLISGPLFDRFPGHPFLGLSLVVAGIGTCLIPSARTSAALFAITAFQGLAMGATDTGANLLIIFLWGSEVGPWMQLLHFSFAIGAALGPLFLRAFYKPIPGNTVTGDYSGAFYCIGALTLLVGGALAFVKSPRSRTDTKIGTLDSAVEEIVVDTTKEKEPSAVESVALRSAAPTPTTAVPTPASATLDQDGFAQYHKQRDRIIWVEVFMMFWLLFLYVGAETGYGGYVTSYAVLALSTTEATGQLLASVFWWAITAGRFSSIFISMRITPRLFLTSSMALSFVFTVMLAVGVGVFKSLETLWAGTVLFGLAMACIFPTSIELAETYWPVKGIHTMVFVVGGAVGEIVLPLVISRFLGDPYAEPGSDDHSKNVPDVLLWTCLAACGINLSILAIVLVLGEGMKRKECDFRALLSTTAERRAAEAAI
ncbi:major facilitator superfamily domain-containing protein [Hyaloraphidium curvatum]|nr:major facilitator superfamily domain-containing protein [Hyaloraphidium curvatum]